MLFRSKPFPRLFDPFIDIRPRDRFANDWVTSFEPPLTVYEQTWRRGDQLRRFRLRVVMFFIHSLGSLLSGGQQQRLTIARALSQNPDLLMLDEFSIAVDPVTTMRIEDVLKELKDEITIVLVTNLVQQARRLADRTAFFLESELVEIAPTEELFTGTVKDQRTRDYVEGRFG